MFILQITLRDVKSISRAQNQLNSSLGQKIYEDNEYDYVFNENNSEMVKLEEVSEFNGINDTGVNEFNQNNDSGNDFKGDDDFDNVPDIDNEENGGDLKPEVEIKDEQTNNEIFFEEYPVFDESDNVTLSEMYKKEKVKKKKGVKKVKEGKTRVKVKKRKEDDDNPSSTMDK